MECSRDCVYGLWKNRHFSCVLLKPFFSSDTPIIKTLSERYSVLVEKDVFMLQVVKCIYSFFGEHRGICAVIIYHFASTAAG